MQSPRAPLTLVVAEHLHAGLGVGVIGRLEAQLGDAWGQREELGGPLGSPLPPPRWPPHTQLAEELPEGAHEVAEGEAAVSHHPLHLVELGQVGGIQALVAENPVDGEVFHRGELLLRGGAGSKG